MMKYKKGDVLVDKDGCERKVLEILGCIYFIEHEFTPMVVAVLEEWLDYRNYTLKSRPKEDWTPEIGEKYYHITYGGTVGYLNWDNDEGDNGRKNFLGIFRTQAEAEARLQEIKDKLK